jgi:predicted glycoside hydrolase/deacetylase ChbG (UPF0249 family)
MRQLVLCSDDFGYSRGISETIVSLARDRRLNAISCMTACPGWEDDSLLLRHVPTGVEIGLHLVLTGERPLTALDGLTDADGRLPSINALQRQARAGTLPIHSILCEVIAQFDRFEEAVGRAPDFVDGHQHAHLLPGIRPIVLELTRRRAPNAWLRDCTDHPAAIAARPFRGKAIGSAFHSAGLRQAAARHGLSCNEGFAGHYGFAGDYAALLPKFLRRAGHRHLVMCHPGAGHLTHDPIAEARIAEAKVLKQTAVADMANDHGLVFAA